MSAHDSITDRIDAALEKMRVQEMQVRLIYLDADDCGEFLRLSTRFWRKALKEAAESQLSYAGHRLRVGKSSIIYSKQGVGVSIPKQLSHRVAA